MIGYKRINKKIIGDLLLEQGIITHAQREKAIAFQNDQGGLFGEILIRLGYAPGEDVARVLTLQYGFPYLPLANYEIGQEAVSSVPLVMCNKFCLIPVDKIGENLALAMANPLNVQAVEAVEALSGCTVQAFVTTAVDVRNAIKKYYL